MPVPIGNYDSTLIFQCAGTVRQATWSMGWDASVGDPTPTELADAIYDAYHDTGRPYAVGSMTPQWSFVGVSVTLETITGPLIGQHLQSAQGTFTGESVPLNCAVLMTKQTAAGGRRNKGRAFLPPTYPVEGDVSAAGVIGSTPVTVMQNQHEAALDALAADDIFPVLFHQSGDQTPTPVTGILISPVLATQRRRMRS